MASLVGDKSKEFTAEIADDSGFYPTLKLADFQKQHGFLEDTTEQQILSAMIMQRVKVHQELQQLKTTYSNLVACSESLFGDASTANEIYKRAVFCLTAATLIGNRLATDATKEAADRQTALMQRNNVLRADYREAVEYLLQRPGITVELI